MLAFIDSFIDRITMYKLLRYYLACLLILALVLSFGGSLPFSPWALIVCTLWSLAVCRISNQLFSRFFHAPVGSDSATITSFILSLIITPRLDTLGILFVTAAAGLAMASKYVLTIRRKHVFNPAAIAVVLTSFGAMQTASWWVGSTVMVPFVIVGGLLIVRKIRRERMVATFLATTTVATGLFTYVAGGSVTAGLKHMALSSAIWFLGCVMLTEPATTPPTDSKQLWYAALVGVLMPPQVHVFSVYASPELALVIGNIFSYMVSSKQRLFPLLKEKLTVAANTTDFVFDPGARFSYQPGQYMEWTLPHNSIDARGDRRYFTLASSPTEAEIRIGVKFYENGSSYKKALLDMETSTPIVAAQLAGDFTLPKDPLKKVAFIAGGIGITPVRSMVKFLTDTRDRRPAVVLYSVRTQEDIAYAPIFDAAHRQIGLKTVYVLSDERIPSGQPNVYGATRITPEIILKEIPDHRERIFYLSGTHQMVTGMATTLRRLGVPRSHIKTDYFPGYA